ncbi:Hypothetical protein ORPV_663 [Orpheovirus IHUMI-LCC2]|uniref:Uncharacterized protein n=1 Tax=Orpheovirus IHUMI-LCC2 TaxID=2023057 RepID=A0A2I2L4W9_9VIRU|nr:Hypothetical protein ORPV_663 [Orpheovirus IHUMI-LCC2]SNW62567.1 Hypothetical protein ORPV_663 [Orpheovirus IHUMI-LCC2]
MEHIPQNVPLEIYTKILNELIFTKDFNNAYLAIISGLTNEKRNLLNNGIKLYIINDIIGININSTSKDIYQAYTFINIMNFLHYRINLNKEFVRIRDYNFFIDDKFKNFIGNHFLGSQLNPEYNIMEVCTLIKILYGVSYDINQENHGINFVYRALEMKYSNILLKDIIDNIKISYDISIILIKYFIIFNKLPLIHYVWNKIEENKSFNINSDDSIRTIIINMCRSGLIENDDWAIVDNYIINTEDLSIMDDLKKVTRGRKKYGLTDRVIAGCKDPVTLTKIMIQNINNPNVKLQKDFISGYEEATFNNRMNPILYLNGLHVRYNCRNILDPRILKSIDSACKALLSSDKHMYYIHNSYCPYIMNLMYKLKIIDASEFSDHLYLSEYWNILSYVVNNNDRGDDFFMEQYEIFDGVGCEYAAILALWCPNIDLSLDWYFYKSNEIFGNFKDWSLYNTYLRFNR